MVSFVAYSNAAKLLPVLSLRLVFVDLTTSAFEATQSSAMLRVFSQPIELSSKISVLACQASVAQSPLNWQFRSCNIVDLAYRSSRGHFRLGGQPPGRAVLDPLAGKLQVSRAYQIVGQRWLPSTRDQSARKHVLQYFFCEPHVCTIDTLRQTAGNNLHFCSSDCLYGHWSLCSVAPSHWASLVQDRGFLSFPRRRFGPDVRC